MSNPIRKALKNICPDISETALIYEHDKKIDLLKHTVLLVKSSMRNQELTDIVMESGVSKSQLSSFIWRGHTRYFIEMCYSLQHSYIMTHSYSVYSRFLSIMGIDSTFIRTRIKESEKYRRQKTENGIKMYEAAVVFPFTMPVESLVTPANLNDSPEVYRIIDGIDPDLVRQSILTFDLGDYDLERFRKLKEESVRFVTQIKKNASWLAPV